MPVSSVTVRGCSAKRSPRRGPRSAARLGRPENQVGEGAARAQLALTLQPGPPRGAQVVVAVYVAEPHIGHSLAGLPGAGLVEIRGALPLGTPDPAKYLEGLIGFAAPHLIASLAGASLASGGCPRRRDTATAPGAPYAAFGPAAAACTLQPVELFDADCSCWPRPGRGPIKRFLIGVSAPLQRRSSATGKAAPAVGSHARAPER